MPVNKVLLVNNVTLHSAPTAAVRPTSQDPELDAEKFIARAGFYVELCGVSISLTILRRFHKEPPTCVRHRFTS